MSDRPARSHLAKPVRSQYIWAILIAGLATVLFVAVLAANVAPWVRGPKAWRWPYAIPGTLRRLWLPALLLLLYAALAWWLDAIPHARAHRRWPSIVAIVVAMVMTPALQFALLYMDHPDIRSQLFYRTVSESANGFFNVGTVVLDRDDFMRHYAERMIDWYPTHPERHPPGLPVLFALARHKVYSQWLALGFAVAFLLNPAIQAANWLEFHPVTLAPTLLLATFYFLISGRTGWYVVFAVLAAGCKEEIALLVLMVGLYAAVVLRRVRLGIITIVLGTALFSWA